MASAMRISPSRPVGRSSSECACGCGALVEPDDRGRPRKFVHGHNARRPMEERFWEKVDQSAGDEGCWLWLGSSRRGYGQFARSHGDPVLAHRLAYELRHGLLGSGIDLHHMCHNRACVNPAHLTPLARAEHLQEHLKTNCKRDHPLSGDNLYINPTTGQRRCRTCDRERNRARRKL
jgi:hypothetical protein